MTGVHAILLAAGAGTRFGGRKLLAPWRGEPLVRWAARAALAAPVGGVVAVTGSDAAEVRVALSDLGGDRLRCVEAPGWAGGIAESLGEGLAALPRDAAGVVVFLGDMPRVDGASAGRLVEALGRGAAGAEFVHRGRPAHPVAFAARLFADLRRLRGDQGGRRLFGGRDDVARIETADEGAVFDVDLRSDIEAE